jgi:hypothetical protein
MAGDMMTKTCTVQANLDYASEEDAMRKLRVGVRAQPIITAMFANSPWEGGKRSGYRARIARSLGFTWIRTAPGSCPSRGKTTRHTSSTWSGRSLRRCFS